VTYGDTLFTIAQRYRVNIYALAAANNITNIHIVIVGQRLIIPPLSPTPTRSITPSEFVAGAFETIVNPTDTTTPEATGISTDTATLHATVTASTLSSAEAASPEPAAAEPTALILNTLTPTLEIASEMSEEASAATDVAAPNTPTITSIPTNTPMPSDSVNGLRIDQFIVLNENARQNIREIYAIGQTLGRNPHAFSKLGDSTIESPFFMNRFDTGTYNLGVYDYLQPVIDYYAGSFGRDSVAVRIGLHTWSVMDPMWADPYTCNSGESLLACEIRLHNPSAIFIRLGTNDAGIPNATERNFRRIIEFCIINGVIPIMGTKADRFDGVNSPNNEIIRRLADEYGLLLWDFDLLAETIPNRGLGGDGVHMTSFYPHDWTQPQALRTGHGVHSLTALMALDAIMESIGTAS
jgi:hypothetical protein